MELLNNKQTSTFEAKMEDGEKGTLEYRWLKGKMVLMHTFVPVSLRGKGVGDALAKFALENAITHRLKLIVYCPFVQKYLTRHPEYQYLTEE